MFGNMSVNNISQAQAKEMMNNDVIVLDVREEYEYASGHIEKSINLPLGRVEYGIDDVTIDKEKTLLVYCHSGARSASATRILHAMGYKNAYNFGGIATWSYGIVR
jgi:phage shock protein E